MSDALRAGVDPADLLFTETETVGSTTDGLAVARFSRAHPQARIEVFASARRAAEHFAVMYPAVAARIEGRPLRFTMHYPPEARPGPLSNGVYLVLKWTTRAAAASGPTFRLWYAALNRVYARRSRGFGRTVQ